MQQPAPPFTRRDFLRLTALALGAAALPACTTAPIATDTPPPTLTATPDPTATAIATRTPPPTITPTHPPPTEIPPTETAEPAIYAHQEALNQQLTQIKENKVVGSGNYSLLDTENGYELQFDGKPRIKFWLICQECAK